jgi:hypothetical protein
MSKRVEYEVSSFEFGDDFKKQRSKEYPITTSLLRQVRLV